MAAIDEHGELHAGRAAVVEQALDRGADRASRVEDVVDEDDRATVERKVQRRLADDRLRVKRRLAAADAHIVAIKGDVDRTERRRLAGPVLDQAGQPLRQRHAAGLDADERDLAELRIRLDDLVGDTRERSRKPVGVEQMLPGHLDALTAQQEDSGRA